MDVKNTHYVFGRQALGAERRRFPSLAVKVLSTPLISLRQTSAPGPLLKVRVGSLECGVTMQLIFFSKYGNIGPGLIISFIPIGHDVFVDQAIVCCQVCVVCVNEPHGRICSPICYKYNTTASLQSTYVGITRLKQQNPESGTGYLI